MPERPLLRIEAWSPEHPGWPELRALIDGEGQRDWVAFHVEFHLSDHVLVALEEEALIGFLRFVVQEIGPDMDAARVMLNGTALTEAKILAFGVLEERRGSGVGRALQQAAIELAQGSDCYQIRSHSSGNNAANHHLKLSMGFGVHPVVRGEDRGGVYFIPPLAGR